MSQKNTFNVLEWEFFMAETLNTVIRGLGVAGFVLSVVAVIAIVVN